MKQISKTRKQPPAVRRRANGLATLALSAATLFSVSADAVAQQSYIFTDLGTLLGQYGNSNATGINAAGQVVGNSITASNTFHATLWNWNGNGMVATDLGTLGGTTSRANVINNAGQIVGYSYIAGNAEQHATLWNGTTVIDLGTLGGTTSAATGINNVGQVVGFSEYASGLGHPTLWNGTTATDLSPLVGTTSTTRSINNAGQIVGTALNTSPTLSHGVIWNQNGNSMVATDLGALSGQYGHNSTATGINATGQVVGNSITTSDTFHATLWNWNGISMVPTDLGTLGGTYSNAYGINNAGQVVGTAYTTSNTSNTQHATLWNGTTTIDLNSFLSASDVAAGWVLSGARAINDNGWIVGDAYNSQAGVSHAFLLSTAAVPEPETYALMLAGLGALGVMIRRKTLRGQRTR